MYRALNHTTSGIAAVMAAIVTVSMLTVPPDAVTSRPVQAHTVQLTSVAETNAATLVAPKLRPPSVSHAVTTTRPSARSLIRPTAAATTEDAGQRLLGWLQGWIVAVGGTAAIFFGGWALFGLFIASLPIRLIGCVIVRTHQACGTADDAAAIAPTAFAVAVPTKPAAHNVIHGRRLAAPDNKTTTAKAISALTPSKERTAGGKAHTPRAGRPKHVSKT